MSKHIEFILGGLLFWAASGHLFYSAFYPDVYRRNAERFWAKPVIKRITPLFVVLVFVVLSLSYFGYKEVLEGREAIGSTLGFIAFVILVLTLPIFFAARGPEELRLQNLRTAELFSTMFAKYRWLPVLLAAITGVIGSLMIGGSFWDILWPE